jgi:hypothetical protein
VFCEKDGSTKEHIIPKWIAKNCGLRGVFLGATTEDARQSRKQPISMGGHRQRFFCEECQEHFRDMENVVKPLVVPMCRYESIPFDASQQRLLARWATKTAYALIASEKGAEQVVPKSQRVELRKSDSPPAGTWVAFALYDGLAQKDVQVHLDEPPGGSEDESRVIYSAFLAFGRVAFKVVGVDKSRDSDVWLRFLGLTRFWPPDVGLVEWPPDTGIRGRAIEGAVTSHSVV